MSLFASSLLFPSSSSSFLDDPFEIAPYHYHRHGPHSRWHQHLLQQQQLLNDQIQQYCHEADSENQMSVENQKDTNTQPASSSSSSSSSLASSSPSSSSSPASSTALANHNNNNNNNNNNNVTRIGVKFRPNALSNIKVDALENDKEFTIHAELPGIPHDNIKVMLDNGVLNISGEKKDSSEVTKKDDKDNTRYHHHERSYGKFSRSFRLPNACLSQQDNIKITFNDNAVLTITVPKSQTQPIATKKQLIIQKI